MSILSAIFQPIADAVGGIVSEIVVDKDQRLQLEAALRTKLMDVWSTQVDAAQAVIVAEAQGESWMQRNWRPSLMFLIMFLLLFNGMIVPLIDTIWGVKLPILEAYSAIPEKMWSLLQIGIGGYIVSRGGEKMVTTWRRKQK